MKVVACLPGKTFALEAGLLHPETHIFNTEEGLGLLRRNEAYLVPCDGIAAFMWHYNRCPQDMRVCLVNLERPDRLELQELLPELVQNSGLKVVATITSHIEFRDEFQRQLESWGAFCVPMPTHDYSRPGLCRIYGARHVLAAVENALSL